MATFKEFDPQDVQQTKSTLTQLIDIAGEDVSGSALNTRRTYRHFASASYCGSSYAVTSSLWQTVYDQDYTIATANPLFDATVGISKDSQVLLNLPYTIDSDGLYIFNSYTAQMRDKLYIYEQYAQTLLGNPSSSFVAPLNSTSANDVITEALFLNVKRLFARDGIKRETIYLRAAYSGSTGTTYENLWESGSTYSIYSDINSNDNKLATYGGNVSNLLDTSNQSICGGLCFLDQGIIVLDMKKIFNAEQALTGTLKLNDPISTVAPFTGTFNSFMASASIDNILDHVFSTRIQDSSDSQISFQNKTNLNSTLFFARVNANEFNYSSNPTYTDSSQNIVVVDDPESDQPFTYCTSVGLYNASNELMGVAKMSRPVLITPEKALTIRVRLDY